MKTVIRCCFAWLCFTAAGVLQASPETASVLKAGATVSEPAARLVGQPGAPTADELAKYEQMDRELTPGAETRRAGASMDRKTVIIIVVVAAVVIAVAAGGGGGGGGY